MFNLVTNLDLKEETSDKIQHSKHYALKNDRRE